MTDSIKPFRCAKLDLPVYGLTAACIDVGQLKTRNTDTLHPLQVLSDPFFGDVAPGPVPPRPRFSRVGWSPEALFERIGCGLSCSLTLGGRNYPIASNSEQPRQ